MKNILPSTLFLLISLQFTQAQVNSLWATATVGGAHGFGTILKGNSDGTNFHTVYSFDSINGSFPIGKIGMSGGKLYGVTALGADLDSCTLFSYDTLTGSLTMLYQFYQQIQYGGEPTGGLVMANDGKFYGMTSKGGANSAGVIYSFDASTETYTDIYDFSDSTASCQRSGEFLLANDGNLYAMAVSAGSNVIASIFSFNLISKNYHVLYSFPIINYFSGVYFSYGGPDLIQASDNKLYGIAGGSGNDAGTLFSYDLLNGVYTDLYDFTSFDGMPQGGLVQAGNGKIYGITSPVLNQQYAEIFSYEIGASNIASEMAVDSTTGFYPAAGPGILGSNKIVGSTQFGGLYGQGVLFTYDINTKVYDKLLDFDDSTTGANPECQVFIAGQQNISGIPAVTAPEGKQLLYPNPTSGQLFLQGTLADSSYIISEVSGKEVLKSTINNPLQSIDVSQLPSGIYLLNKTRFIKE